MSTVARDVMSSHVISVAPEAALIDVYRLFVEEGIHGAPVVGDDREVQGVITSADLLRAVSQEHESASSETRYFRDDMEFSGPDWGSVSQDFQNRMAQIQVSDVMTPGVVLVAPTEPVPAVAHAMRANQVHRVFVLEDETVVGVVSALDLVALLEKD